MNKLLFILYFLVTGSIASKAQCTIVSSCTPTGWYCSTPATGDSLPNAIEMSGYNTTIQMSLASTYTSATIDSAKITAVSGLPNGISYSTNPINGVINGGANGCLLITGTPTSGTAGSYVVSVSVTIYSNLGEVHPPSLTWSLSVDVASGIENVAINKATILVIPNPAKSQITLSSNFHFHYLTILNILGNIIISQEVNGISKLSINLDNLNSGMYFLQISDGNKSTIQKFIKE